MRPIAAPIVGGMLSSLLHILIVNAIIDRLKSSLTNQCLPQKLTQDSSNAVPCLILAQLANSVGPGACANPPLDATGCDATKGLLGPGIVPSGATGPTLTQDILSKFCSSQEAAYTASGGKPGDPNDPDLFPTCALQQLIDNPAANASDFDATGSCASGADPGWCYVEGAAASGCQQAILFTNNEPPQGSTVSLQCIEQSVTVIDGGTD